MPDTTTTATPPVTDPAAAAPATGDAATPAAAPTLADVKAARRTKVAAAARLVVKDPESGTETGDVRPAPKTPPIPATAPAPVVPPKPPEAKPPETAKIDMDPKSLTEFTQLNREVRETKAKLADAEKKLADFGKIEKARLLAKEGKHYDAIKEAGIFDLDAALAELIGQNNGKAPSPELLALQRQVDELKAKDADADKAKTEAQAAAAKAGLENDRKIAGRFVTEEAAKYPALAKAPEFVDGAFKDFTDARAKLEKETGAPLPSEEQAKLMIDALAVHEEKWAKCSG